MIQEIQTTQTQLDSFAEESAGASAADKLRYILACRLAWAPPKKADTWCAQQHAQQQDSTAQPQTDS